jgi:streptogramin lyase
MTATAIAACSGGDHANGPQSIGSSSAASATGEVTSSAGPSASPIPLSEPALPDIQTIGELGGVTMRATHAADWVVVANGRAWVTGLGKGIGVFDARTGRPQGSVSVPHEPCAAAAVGFGAIWTATCGDTRGVVRIDPHRARVTDRVDLAIAQPESSLGAGEGAVWAIANGTDCSNCVLARIDPATVTITDRFPLPPGASAVRAGLGGVWITYFGDVHVLRVNPTDGAIEATIPVGAKPAFLDIGGGSVWVMASADGALCRIDPTSNRVLSRTVLDPGGAYGDLTVGNGFVWWRGADALVTQVDQRSGEVVRRIGLAGPGDGSAAAGSGQLWISAHEVARLYRVPVR